MVSVKQSKRLRAETATLGEHKAIICRPSDHKRRVQYFEGDCWNGSSIGRLSTGARGESKLLRNVSAIGRRLQKSSCRSERHPATKSGGKSCAAARRRASTAATRCPRRPEALVRYDRERLVAITSRTKHERIWLLPHR